MTGAAWSVRGGSIPLDRPVVMGILNVTPDSFSDGGRYVDARTAVAHGLRLVEQGADLVDVGAESTRPGADPVDAETEWRRLADVVGPLARAGVTVSIDTTKESVARRAIEAGGAVVNDVSALRASPGIAELCGATGAGLVLMHMRGDPRTMQDDTGYEDVAGEVAGYLAGRVAVARAAGCAPGQLVVDPGIGFGKSLDGNLALLAKTGDLSALGYPVLIGVSRKTFIGQLLDTPAEERVEGTIAACVAALDRGARIFRVHDVLPVRRALDVAEAIRRAG